MAPSLHAEFRGRFWTFKLELKYDWCDSEFHANNYNSWRFATS